MTPWLGVVFLPLVVLLAMDIPARESQATDSRVLIAGSGRQLRTVTVETKGYAGPGAGATVAEQRTAAQAQARRQAVAKVRSALEREIQDKGLELEFDFPGCSPEEAVFVLESVDIPEGDSTRQGVRIRAQVAYLLVFPAALNSFLAGGAKPLKMRPAGERPATSQGAKERIQERDNNFLEQFLLLEQGLKKKLGGMVEETK